MRGFENLKMGGFENGSKRSVNVKFLYLFAVMSKVITYLKGFVLMNGCFFHFFMAIRKIGPKAGQFNIFRELFRINKD